MTHADRPISYSHRCKLKNLDEFYRFGTNIFNYHPSSLDIHRSSLVSVPNINSWYGRLWLVTADLAAAERVTSTNKCTGSNLMPASDDVDDASGWTRDPSTTSDRRPSNQSAQRQKTSRNGPPIQESSSGVTRHQQQPSTVNRNDVAKDVPLLQVSHRISGDTRSKYFHLFCG